MTTMPTEQAGPEQDRYNAEIERGNREQNRPEFERPGYNTVSEPKDRANETMSQRMARENKENAEAAQKAEKEQLEADKKEHKMKGGRTAEEVVELDEEFGECAIIKSATGLYSYVRLPKNAGKDKNVYIFAADGAVHVLPPVGEGRNPPQQPKPSKPVGLAPDTTGQAQAGEHYQQPTAGASHAGEPIDDKDAKPNEKFLGDLAQVVIPPYSGALFRKVTDTEWGVIGNLTY